MKFRFLDKIIAWTPHRGITGLKAVSFEEYCLKEAFGDEPGLPAMLALESFLQLGNWLLLLSSDFRQMGQLVRIKEVRFCDRVRPGEQMRLDVTLVRRRTDGCEFTGEGRVDGRLVITGFGCLAVPVRAAEFVNPDDLRVLFSEIHAPERSHAD